MLEPAELQLSLAAASPSFAQLSEYPPSLPLQPVGVNPAFFPPFQNLQPHQTKTHQESFGLGRRWENTPLSVYHSNGYLMSLLTYMEAAVRGNKGF